MKAENKIYWRDQSYYQNLWIEIKVLIKNLIEIFKINKWLHEEKYQKILSI